MGAGIGPQAAIERNERTARKPTLITRAIGPNPAISMEGTID
jgi:hypothetical protein